MKTPIYDFLKKYAESDTLRCHMPGHKGDSPENLGFYRLDITEISGADSLFEADGIILESERNMSALYGTAATFYSAGGSTLCIQAMLAAAKFEGRTVIAVRNVHRAFLNACALLDIDVQWVMPEYSDGILSGEIPLNAVEKELRRYGNAALYVTSPDYTGRTADIKALAELCHRYGAVLIVDNAHGAHLHFFPESRHPIALGADMCCDSAHKMLPALTGAAMLHTSSERYAEVLRQYMSLFASTSPSYLIMGSLDLCNKYIEERIRGDIMGNIFHLAKLRKAFSDRLSFADGDPFHVTIEAGRAGLDGKELADILHKYGAECEYSDHDIVVLLMSPMNTAKDYERLTAALEKALAEAQRGEIRCGEVVFPMPKKVMTVREAVFAPSETVPVEEAEGRICAAVLVPCPPAVPIAASGEVIDRNCVELFRRYGIERVSVVAND